MIFTRAVRNFAMDQNQQFLFICGCPRSGTTALRSILTCHSGVCIGHERYSKFLARGGKISSELFRPARFLRFDPQEIFYTQEQFDSFHSGFQEKIATCNYIGDKIPELYHKLEEVERELSNALIIFLLRNILDVAESYNLRARNQDDPYWTEDKDASRAIRDWNQSLKSTMQALHRPQSNLIVLEYEHVFSDPNRMQRFIESLGLEVTDEHASYITTMVERSHELSKNSERRSTRQLTNDQKHEICCLADFQTYRQLRQRAWQ